MPQAQSMPMSLETNACCRYLCDPYICWFLSIHIQTSLIPIYLLSLLLSTSLWPPIVRSLAWSPTEHRQGPSSWHQSSFWNLAVWYYLWIGRRQCYLTVHPWMPLPNFLSFQTVSFASHCCSMGALHPWLRALNVPNIFVTHFLADDRLPNA